MLWYVVRRLMLIVPTLLGIMIINFVVIQFAPGGPIEQVLAQLDNPELTGTSRVTNVGSSEVQDGSSDSRQLSSGAGGNYRGGEGLEPAYIEKLEERFGLDKPLHERFFIMMGRYLTFDFGESFFQGKEVIDLVLEKMPVSISLGLWTTLLVYLISIPLGVRKAVRDGSRFDVWTSAVVIIGNAIPAFLFAILLLIIFSKASSIEFLQIFPLGGLTSPEWSSLAWHAKIFDYFWHMVLPISAMVIGGFATLTFLTKNSFIDQINQQYVLTARAKGLGQRRILYGHVFRNAMLIVIAGFPSAFVGILFTGSLLIEFIFNLDGLGLLGFNAVIDRDYPIVFATLYFFTLLGLVMNLIGDLTYTFIDPRIDFETRGV